MWNCVVLFVFAEGCAFPAFFPSISHGTSSFKTIVGHLFEGRSAAVIIRTLVMENNFSSDQFSKLLFSSFIILPNLGMAGPHMPIYQQERMAGKGIRSDANERHAHLLTCAVWHRSLHGPIKINITISGRCHIHVFSHGIIHCLFLLS